jgi:5'-nucleotidase
MSILLERPSLPLIVGVSTRAMFDLETEHAVFERQGVQAYAELQRSKESEPLEPGAAFEVIRRLLALNEGREEPLVEVILLSRNSPDLSLRAFHSCTHHQLSIKHGSFVSGRPVAPWVAAWNIDLFLSNDDSDVRDVVATGTAAARLGPSPTAGDEDRPDEVRLALDGDSVVFDDDSDNRYKREGLESFHAHEQLHAKSPMARGPFGKTFLPKLAMLRTIFMQPNGVSRVRVAIVTARNAPSHERVIHTLRAWGTPADEAHFVGRHEKAPILKATRAHMFFDDQERHVTGASLVVPAGLVPGSHAPNETIIPA